MRNLGYCFLLWACFALNASEPSFDVEFDSNSSAAFESFEQPGAYPFLEGEGVIEGVNVVTGKYLDHCIDISTHGLDPLLVERYYSRSRHNGMTYINYDAPNFLGWYLNYDNFFYLDSTKQNVALADRTGVFLLLHRNSINEPFKVPYPDGFKGFMNHTSGELSGQRHLINAYLQQNNQEGFDLFLGDGSVRHFGKKERAAKISFQSTAEWERKPSGNKVIYSDEELKTVASDGQTVINSLHFDWRKDKSLVVEADDGRRVQYIPLADTFWFRGSPVRLLDYVVLPDGNQIKYHYDFRLQHGVDFFRGKDLPGGNYLRLYYSNAKVSAIKKPIGVSNESIVAHQFSYGEGFTEVFDANQNRTRYSFNNEGRITRIDRPSGAQVRNVWSANGCLIGKALFDANGKAIVARRFHYDDRGNVLIEQIFGNLTGKAGQPIQMTAEGLPAENGVECYTKKYTYSNDGRNLLLKETDGISTTCYTYQRDTNLLTGKFIYDQAKMRRRQFRTYDVCGALASLIEDDGTSLDPHQLTDCTYRKVTRMRNRMQAPAVGQPEIVEEKYFDFQTQQEQLMKKTVYCYNSQNECIREDIYDCFENHCYSIQRAYDVMKRRIFETDPLGNATHWAYDAAGNIIQKKGPFPGLIESYTYDVANRLIATKEEGEDVSRTTHFRYDLVGNQLAKVDAGGNETLYTYDSANRVIQITYPPTLNEKGETYQAVEYKRYDAADNVIEWINPRGDRILTDYNARGQPVNIQTITKEGEISNEFFEYDLRGNCIKKTAPNGLVTSFTYDFLDRVVKTCQRAPLGELMAETHAAYNAFFLTSATDAEGMKTRITYDFAGREAIIEKDIDASRATRTEKSYDSFGNLIAVKDWYGDKSDAYTVKRMQYDFAGNLTEEKTEDRSGRVYEKRSYAYDQSGNETHFIEWTVDGTEAATTRRFDALGRKIEEKDPSGYYVRTDYQETIPNGRNQLCLYKKETDPAGNCTETFYDARLRPELIIKKDGEGTLLVHQRLYYDEVGNLVLQREAVHANDPQTKWAVTRFSYTYNGKQTEMVEDVEGIKPRATHFFYNKAGELIRKQTPLGSIEFAYDALGRLIQQHAVGKDKTPAIDTIYKYDRNGRIVEATQNKQSTTRRYNGIGNLINEKQISGLSIAYTYDRQGRRTKMQLPDGTAVEYCYQGPELYQIQRLGKKNKLLYTHTYVQRDPSGKILSAKLGGKAGGVSFNYDQAGHLQVIGSSLWKQQASYDFLGHLKELSTEQVLAKGSIKRKASFDYDGLGRLTAEAGSINQSYKYDSLDNRLDGEMGTLNQLVKSIGCTFLWDEEGRLMGSSGAKAYKCSYDALGRLFSFNKTTYSYDAFDRRIGKNSEWFLYDGAQEIGLFSKKGNCSEMRVLGEGLGAERGATIALEINDKILAPLHDVRGNIAALIDTNSGKAVEGYDYSAFGQITYFDQAQKKASISWVGNSWGWNGKRTDKESGWVFFGKRHYFAEIGRWTTPDPLGFIDGSNRYNYVHQNPLTHSDLLGEFDIFRSFRRDVSCEYMGRLNHRMTGMTAAVGKDMIPLPGSRDLIESTGRWGIGGKFLDIAEYRKPSAAFLQKKENEATHLSADLNEIQSIKEGNFDVTTVLKAMDDRKETYNFCLNEPFLSRSALKR